MIRPIVATDASIEQPVARALPLPDAGLALSGLVGSAGLIHVIASAEHVGADWSLGVFFLLVGAGQLVAARAVHRNPRDERLLALVAGAGVAIALLWIFSRTTGLPVGPDAGEIAKVGVADTIATLQELAFAAIVATIAWRGERAVAWLSGPLGVRLTFAVLSLTLMLAAFGGHEH